MYIVCQYNIAQYIVFKAILLSKDSLKLFMGRCCFSL